MTFLIIMASIIGGVLLSSQSSINGSLSKKTGVYESTFITFITGALILFILVLFFGNGNLLSILDAPKWQLSAVWFGVGYLFLTILSVPKIGVIATNISTVIGQLSMGLLIDHFGWFNGIQVTFDMKRLIAIILMLLALTLLYISNKKSSYRNNEL